jgi:hypothetical protein
LSPVCHFTLVAWDIVGSEYQELQCGENLISIGPATDIARFIRQITDRHAEIERMLEEVQRVGYAIERRPYADYIDEIERTGVNRVVLYGFGVFVDGRLSFHPERSTF